MPALDATLQQKTARLEAEQRLRSLQETAVEEGAWVIRNGRRLLNFSSNDYLGLNRHPQVKAAAQEAVERYGAGAGASRLVTGNHPLYAGLESALARHKGTEAALVFGSGYLANIGAITALTGRDDLILADKLAHACILDGARLSGAKLVRFTHNDAADCARLLATHRAAYGQCLVITETVFSMDGDTAPLAELRALCDQYDAWLMTDDAHGLGKPSPVPVEVQMGTLSKAFGAYGGYICGSSTLIRYLASSARSFIFTTGLPPATVAAAIEALKVMHDEPERLAIPLQRAQQFTDALGLPPAQSQIVPLVIGGEEETLRASQDLEETGFLVSAIRPPTVPERTSRLRFSFSVLHEEKDIDHLINALMTMRRNIDAHLSP